MEKVKIQEVLLDIMASLVKVASEDIATEAQDAILDCFKNVSNVRRNLFYDKYPCCNNCRRSREDERGLYCGFDSSIVNGGYCCGFYKS